jgi:single-stranded-DNA-specific exonuclease
VTDDWIPTAVPAAASDLIAAGIAPLQARLLAQRGVRTADEARTFLRPEIGHLSEPRRLRGLPEALERLIRAGRDREVVAIVGDYDVDGVAATALLTAALRAAGARPRPILAHRHEEGYGFQPLHVRRARELGAAVLITVDCGTNAREAASAARGAGLDLIVTDHHLPDGGPAIDAVLVNPRQAGCDSPARELTGAGIAFKLATALLEGRGREVPWEALLRVACLGTIADVAPLTGENRVIAALGLRALGEPRSEGLRALIESAGLRPPLRAADVGFRLGPRLNAAGRLGAADPALELLLTRDRERARELAAGLEQANRERQELESGVLRDADGELERDETAPIFVAWGDGWNRGVVGIAAARLARRLSRPVVLLAADGEMATGSGRSVPGVHLHDFLRPWAARLERFGGHEQAVGLTVRRDRLPELAREWREAARAWPAETLAPPRVYDLDLPAERVSEPLLAELESLEPFGAGNPEPVFRIGALRAFAPARAFGRGHAELRVGPAEGPPGAGFELVAWGWEERNERELPDRFEILARIERDRWRGGARAVLQELRPIGRPPH